MKKFFLLILVFVLSGCSLMEPVGVDVNKPPRPEFGQGVIEIETERGDKFDLNVEVAKTEEQKSFGLMYVDELKSDTGMLFVYDNKTKPSFWMKNTLIPLDIIFIDEEYYVVDIFSAPPCKTRECLVYTPEHNANYVLEVNSGFASKKGINENAKIYPLVLEY